jgi:hypothetical protein
VVRQPARERGDQRTGSVVPGQAYAGQPSYVVVGNGQQLAGERDGHQPGGRVVGPRARPGQVDEGQVSRLVATVPATLVDDAPAAGLHVDLEQGRIRARDVPAAAGGLARLTGGQLHDAHRTEVTDAQPVTTSQLAARKGQVERAEGALHHVVPVVTTGAWGLVVSPV